MKIYPSQERLRELFDYDPEGFLVWKENAGRSRSWNAQRAGKKAGCNGFTNKGGYFSVIGINGKDYNLLKIIWIFHYGAIANEYYVKNSNVFYGDKIENMRLCKCRQGIHSGKRIATGSVDYKGVSKTKAGNYKAVANKNCNQINLGVYKTPEAAASAYDEWAVKNIGDGYVLNDSGCKNYKDQRITVNNQRASKNNSGYRGAYKKQKNWQAMISIDGKRINLGRFNSSEAAARAYNIAARNHYGDLAILNDIPNPLGEVF